MNYKALDFFGAREIQVVVIENPYDIFEHSEEVQRLMCKVWKMKLEGYKAHYDYGILPVGEADWFSNQTFVCEVINGELEPFFGYKQVTSAHCKKMNKDFPIIQHLFSGQEEEAKDYISGINNFVKEKEDEGELVGYNSGWTLSRKAANDKELKEIAFNISLSMFYHYYNSYEIKNIICAASAKFKVWRIKETMGFGYLKFNEIKLAPHPSNDFFGEEFYIMHLENNQFSKEFSEECEKHRHLWEARKVINEASLRPMKVAPLKLKKAA